MDIKLWEVFVPTGNGGYDLCYAIVGAKTWQGAYAFVEADPEIGTNGAEGCNPSTRFYHYKNIGNTDQQGVLSYIYHSV